MSLESIDEVVENFSLFDDWEERYQYMIDLGKTLPLIDTQFKTDADKIANYCARRLGYPLTDIELQDINFWAAFEDAITRSNQWIEENKLINNLDIKDKIFLFGGAQIYKLGLQYCNVIEITKVIFDTNVGTKFPMLEEEKWNKIKLEHFNLTMTEAFVN